MFIGIIIGVLLAGVVGGVAMVCGQSDQSSGLYHHLYPAGFAGFLELDGGSRMVGRADLIKCQSRPLTVSTFPSHYPFNITGK